MKISIIHNNEFIYNQITEELKKTIHTQTAQFIPFRGDEESTWGGLPNGTIDFIIQEISALPYPLANDFTIASIIKFEEIFFAIISLKTGANPFTEIDLRNNWGKVEIVGFGAGNSDLLTVKALRLLNECDAILYDDLIDEQAITNFNCEKIYVGKRKGQHSFDQAVINELIYQTALKGKHVVRLKGGDPLLFGRCAEEFHYLQRRGVEAEITPGITSAFAAAAQYAIPLTDRNLAGSVVFLSGHNMDRLRIPKADTLVFYMGASNQQPIAKRLLSEGWRANTPVALIQEASYSHSQSVRTTIGDIAQEPTSIGSPAIIIVGEVAQSGYGKRRRWLFTGTQPSDYNTDDVIVHSPMISILPIDSNDEIKEVIKDINSYQRIVFMSRYAVQCFFHHLFDNKLDVRAIASKEISAIGYSASDKQKKFGLLIDPLPQVESIDSVIDYFNTQNIKNERILIPQSSISTNKLPNALQNLGNKVTTLAIYKNEMPDSIIKHDLNNFYGVVFTSPSTKANFIKTYGEIPAHLKVISRGVESYKEVK